MKIKLYSTAGGLFLAGALAGALQSARSQEDLQICTITTVACKVYPCTTHNNGNTVLGSGCLASDGPPAAGPTPCGNKTGTAAVSDGYCAYVYEWDNAKQKCDHEVQGCGGYPAYDCAGQMAARSARIIPVN